MNLVKFGQVTINFDQVRFIRDQGSAGGTAPVVVEFASGQPLEVHDQANAVRSWVVAHATDSTGPPTLPNNAGP